MEEGPGVPHLFDAWSKHVRVICAKPRRWEFHSCDAMGEETVFNDAGEEEATANESRT